MTGIICTLAGGASARYTGSAVVTTGRYYDPNPSFSFQYLGYSNPTSTGSITPNTWGGTNANFLQVMYVQIYTNPTQWVTFGAYGSFPNSGWETMTVGATTLNRSAASYDNNGSQTTWTWSGQSNLFGSAGNTRTVTWA